MLLPLPRADDERVVRLDGHDPPEFLDQVGIKVAVGCGLDVSGVGAEVQGTFLFSVHHYVTRPVGRLSCGEVPARVIHVDTRERHNEKLGIWLENASTPS